MMVVIGSVVAVVSQGAMIGDNIEGRVNGRAAVNLQWGCGEMGAWGVRRSGVVALQ